jgi:hypothetical protein
MFTENNQKSEGSGGSHGGVHVKGSDESNGNQSALGG